MFVPTISRNLVSMRDVWHAIINVSQLYAYILKDMNNYPQAQFSNI